MKAKLCLVLIGVGMGICAASLIMLLVYYDFLVDREAYIEAQAEKLGYRILENGDSGNPQHVNPSQSEPQGSVNLVIGEGMTAEQIADKLVETGLIMHKDNFLHVVKNLKVESSFRAGEHQLLVGMSVMDIIAALTASK